MIFPPKISFELIPATLQNIFLTLFFFHVQILCCNFVQFGGWGWLGTQPSISLLNLSFSPCIVFPLNDIVNHERERENLLPLSVLLSMSFHSGTYTNGFDNWTVVSINANWNPGELYIYFYARPRGENGPGLLKVLMLGIHWASGWLCLVLASSCCRGFNLKNFGCPSGMFLDVQTRRQILG